MNYLRGISCLNSRIDHCQQCWRGNEARKTIEKFMAHCKGKESDIRPVKRDDVILSKSNNQKSSDDSFDKVLQNSLKIKSQREKITKKEVNSGDIEKKILSPALMSPVIAFSKKYRK